MGKETTEICLICAPSPTGRHFWKVAPQNGRVSHAICKWCGISNEFRNSATEEECNRLVVRSPYKVGYQKGRDIY